MIASLGCLFRLLLLSASSGCLFCLYMYYFTGTPTQVEACVTEPQFASNLMPAAATGIYHEALRIKLPSASWATLWQQPAVDPEAGRS